jgi:hypothetical protein
LNPLIPSNVIKYITSGAQCVCITSRGEHKIAQTQVEEFVDRKAKDRNYRIDIGAYGSICIEAPTKEEVLELFREVTSTKQKLRIDEAIR